MSQRRNLAKNLSVTAPSGSGKEGRFLLLLRRRRPFLAFATSFPCRKSSKSLSLASVQVPYFSAMKSSLFETTTGVAQAYCSRRQRVSHRHMIIDTK